MGLASEMWAFMRERKKFWLLPVIVAMLLVGPAKRGGPVAARVVVCLTLLRQGRAG